MTLIDILHKHGAALSIEVGGTDYSTHHAHISFVKSEIEVVIYDDEGSCIYDYDEPIPYQYIQKITAFVEDLKEAKAIPNYTLSLTPEV